jgi:predicted DNA-binding transcriptional regulator AlpA
MMPEELRTSENPPAELKLRPMLPKKAVLEMTGHSENALDAQIAKGTFPAPVKIGPRSIRFFLDEVVKWQQDRAAERDIRRRCLDHERAEREARRGSSNDRNT